MICFASKGERRYLPSTLLAKNAFQGLQNCLLLSFMKNFQLHLKTDQPSLSWHFTKQMEVLYLHYLKCTNVFLAQGILWGVLLPVSDTGIGLGYLLWGSSQLFLLRKIVFFHFPGFNWICWDLEHRLKREKGANRFTVLGDGVFCLGKWINLETKDQMM